MANYAVVADVTAFLGYAAPSGTDRLITRASELMDVATMNKLNVTPLPDATTLTRWNTAMKNAVCAQIEFWVESGESADINGPVQGYSVGSLQIQFGAGDSRISPTYLAPRANRYLLLAGLLYRGVSY